MVKAVLILQWLSQNIQIYSPLTDPIFWCWQTPRLDARCSRLPIGWLGSKRYHLWGCGRSDEDLSMSWWAWTSHWTTHRPQRWQELPKHQHRLLPQLCLDPLFELDFFFILEQNDQSNCGSQTKILCIESPTWNMAQVRFWYVNFVALSLVTVIKAVKFGVTPLFYCNAATIFAVVFIQIITRI